MGVNGRASDAAAWDVSGLQGLEDNSLNIPAAYVIAGDDAFPLKRNIMKPFPF